METINTKAVCITCFVEWHGEMFLIFHRGNVKALPTFAVANLKIGNLVIPIETPMFSTRKMLLDKFSNEWHGKYQVVQVVGDRINQMQFQVLKVALKELSPACHIWNSNSYPVP